MIQRLGVPTEFGEETSENGHLQENIKMKITELDCEDEVYGIGSGLCLVEGSGISSINLRVLLPECWCFGNKTRMTFNIPK
jgi:hypothetical protein